MNDLLPIVCKPTSWFLRRALGMLAMFAFLGAWFYKDASTGYRKENEIFLTNQAFATAAAEYQKQNATGSLTAEEWKTYAAAQHIDFGDDLSIIPATIPQPQPWPAELQDSAVISKGQGEAWEMFSGRMKWDRQAPEKLHDARSINEQWYYCYGLSVLAVITLFIFLRTMRRKIVVDHEKIITQEGKQVLFGELHQLDLRKWQTKGIAFGQYTTAAGSKGKIRFDGLTYGGFEQEQGEPAEKMMQRVRAHFHGEVIEYAQEEEPSEEAAAEESSPESPKS